MEGAKMSEVGAEGQDLVLDTQRHGAAAIVRVKGELDAYSAPSLEDLGTNLLADGVTEIVLDLAATSFVDSSGLRAILTLHRRIENDRGELALGNPSEPVLRLLEITGLTEHFTIRHDAEH
jgi:anti-sigma B factor antagonist